MSFESALEDAFTILRYPNVCQQRISSLAVRYHKPYVDRISVILNNKPCGYNRIYFHKIYPCTLDEALYHPHPWPSLVHIVKGGYDHQIGTKNEIICSQFLEKDSLYIMENKKAWHRVAPREEALSMMLVKDLWEDPEPFEKPKEKQRELTDEEFFDVVKSFMDQT